MALVGAIGHPTSKADFAKSQIEEVKPKKEAAVADPVMQSTDLVPKDLMKG